MAGGAGVAGFPAWGQTPANAPPAKPPTPVTYAGCVQKAPDSDTILVISTAKVCATLNKGQASDKDFSEEKLAGHEVELKGVLTPRTASVAASIEVNSVVSVGKSCTDVCALRPPATRGLHRPDPAAGDAPGADGGTPGLAPPPQ